MAWEFSLVCHGLAFSDAELKYSYLLIPLKYELVISEIDHMELFSLENRVFLQLTWIFMLKLNIGFTILLMVIIVVMDCAENM